MNIADKVFLVAGGASGLGAATAGMLVGAGARVLVMDLNPLQGQAQTANLGSSALFCETDVTQSESVDRAVALAQERLGPIRGLINCAGVAIAQRVLSRSGPHNLEAFSRVIHVNLIGTFNTIRLAAEAIAKTEPLDGGERGVIVNTASVAAFDGQVGQPAYAASKGGVVSLTLPIARELAGVGIRVMAIAPGIFDTPMLAGLPEAARQSLGNQVPFPSRLGRPDEYAALVRHIIENPMLNGEVIRLDGAIRMAPR